MVRLISICITLVFLNVCCNSANKNEELKNKKTLNIEKEILKEIFVEGLDSLFIETPAVRHVSKAHVELKNVKDLIILI